MTNTNTKARSTYNIDEEETDTMELTLPVEDEVDPPTHPPAYYFAPCQHQAVTTLQGLLETMSIDDQAGHRC